jgi:hypothetical protein
MIKPKLLGKMLRYGAASVGPVGSAGSQFLLSLVLLHALGQRDFGAFSFLLVASQFSWGLWSAMFCAPLPILFHANSGSARAALVGNLFSSNLVVACLAAPIFYIMATALDVTNRGAILFAVYGSVALLRWFARAYAYASGTPYRTMASDLVYSATLLAGIALILITGGRSLDIAYGALLAGALMGMLPFGIPYLKQQFCQVSARAVTGYFPIWKRHSGWSLMGVLTTEATANSHVYIVTAFFGPKAFAPIAASALMIRPINVAMNALTEFERAQMARQVGSRQFQDALAAVRFFRWVMVAAWAVTVTAAFILLRVSPRALFPSQYPLNFLLIGASLWMLVAGVRLLRMPESTLLQAAGEFRPLALTSVFSSIFSVVAVVILLLTLGVLWSIAGIVIGETVYCVWVHRECRRWLRREIDIDLVPVVAG